MSFYIESASVVQANQPSKYNLTVTLRNTGSDAIKLGGLKGVPPPSGTNYASGTFHAYFYSASGTRVYGCAGTPPNTANGGSIRVTYLVTGASVGESLTIVASFTQDSQTATDSTSVTVT